jgi:acyl-CoA thioester hydrolase
VKEYELNIKVEAVHLDGLKHVNNVVYLQWVQEVASKHWYSLAPEGLDVHWVVRKHSIEYFKPALEGDVLRLRTWVQKMEGISSLRRVEIYRGPVLLVSCATEWIMLDAQSGRPKRISAELSKLFY